MISQKIYIFKQGPVKDIFTAILPAARAFSVFPGTVSSSRRAFETCPGDGANPTAQTHSLTGFANNILQGD